MGKYEPKQLDQLDPKVAEIAIETMRIRQKNSDLVSEIESLGGEIDITTARLEHFMAALVELGILTDEQLWNMQRDWERVLLSQLKPVKQNLQAAMAEAKKERLTPKLIIPGR